MFEDMLDEINSRPESSEAFEYGARVAPFQCADETELGDWFVGFASACREALEP